jgi:hypothetical protein
MKQLYARYRMRKVVASIRALEGRDPKSLDLEDRLIQKYSQSIPIWFQGVWDTVGTLGVPIPYLPRVSRRAFKFLETDLHIDHTHAFHAIAIDEHRPDFKPTLWVKSTNKTGDNFPPRQFAQVEQRWFVGAHANVGGGYADDLLAQAPLRWIAARAVQHGLVLRHQIDSDVGDTQSPVRNSFAEMAWGLYRVARLGIPHLRKIGAEPLDTGTAIVSNINESIDASVFDRWRADSNYRPANLVEWANRHGIKPVEIKSSVKASAPLEVLSE